MGAGILTDQNQPIITPDARARLARFLGILSRHRVAVFILVILGIWFLGQLRNPGSGPSSSGSAPSQNTQPVRAEQANGSVRVNDRIGGCPEDWQILDVIRFKFEGDQKAAVNAMYRYGCKTFHGPTDVWIEARGAGYVCARPRGEPRCYWMPSELIPGEK